MTKGLLISRKSKEKLYNKMCKNPSFTNCDRFKEFNKTYSKLCRWAKVLYFRNKFNDAAGNMRATWDSLREALNTPKSCNKLPGYFKDKGKKVKSNLIGF